MTLEPPGTLGGRPARQPDLITHDDLDAELCTVLGGDHDYAPFQYLRFNRPHTSWRCVWCRAVACGDFDEVDPCIEPYHHHVDHRSRSGVRWPLGGDRPDRHREGVSNDH